LQTTIPKEKSLWQDQAFVLFWAARAVSLIGATVSMVVLPIMVYRLSSSAFLTSLSTGLQVLPYFFFGFIAGAIADRANRKRLMVNCDFINAVVLGSIPFAYALGVLTLPHIFIAALLSASVFVWFDAANFGALPALVGRDRVVEANSNIWSVTTLMQIAGPALGGFLAATIGPEWAMSINAISYALSGGLIMLIPRALNAERKAATSNQPVVNRMLNEIGEGLAFIWRQPLVRVMTLTGFGNSFTGGAIIGLLVIYGVQNLQLPKDDVRLGILYSAGAVGGLLASLVLPRLSKRFPVGYITLLSTIFNPLLIFGLATAFNFYVALIYYMFWNAAYFLVIINGVTLRQLVTPDHLMGRVNITARMIAWGGTPFGALVGGLFTEWFGVTTAFLLMTIPVIISAIFGWFSPLRNGKMANEYTVVQ
jgi:Transmembrane secretion effector